MATHTRPRWQRELRDRLRTRWLLKFVCISASIWAFMGVYFLLLNHPQFAVTTMPRVALDHKIPFVSWAVVPYVSLWLYIGLLPGLLYPRGEMLRYVAAALTLCVIGCAVFYFFPTQVPSSAIEWSRWPLVGFLKSTDAGGNAFPSLHVAFAVLTAIGMAWLLRHAGAPVWLHAVNVVWCLLIVWSTLATRQHVVLDVAAGAALGAVVALAYLHTWRRKHADLPVASRMSR